MAITDHDEKSLILIKYANLAFNLIVKVTIGVYFLFSAAFLIIYLFSREQGTTQKPIAFIFFQGVPMAREPTTITHWPFPLDNALSFLVTITIGIIGALLLMRQALLTTPLDEKQPISSLNYLVRPLFGKKEQVDHDIDDDALKKHFLLGLASLVLYSISFLMLISATLQGMVANSTTNDLVLLVLGIGGGLILSVLVGLVGVLEGMGKHLGSVGFIMYFVFLTILVAILELILTGSITYGNLLLSLTGIGIIGGGVGFLGGMIILERKIFTKMGLIDDTK